MSNERRDQTERWDAESVRAAEQRRSSRSAAQKRARKRKGRVRRFFLWLIFVVVVSAILAGVGWLLANDLCAFNKESLSATIEITKDDDLGSVADKLKDEGLIEYKWFFKIFGKLRHADRKIGVGTYELDTTMDYNALINAMRNKDAALGSNVVKLTIYEGYTVRQIIAQMAKYGVNTEEALTEAAKNYDFGYDFIPADRKGELTRLEGYLFPDTYEFFVNEEAPHALDRLLSNFQSKMSGEMKEKVDASSYTLSQIMTIASLIEKETDGSDRARIASVIYNRLNNVGETYHLLQIDAAQIYGLGDRYTGTLKQSDLDIDTPYNTHLHEGLPPTPIANPGMASIEAALEPEDTGYYFYALGKDKTHHFFRTYAEFLQFVNSDQYAR